MAKQMKRTETAASKPEKPAKEKKERKAIDIAFELKLDTTPSDDAAATMESISVLVVKNRDAKFAWPGRKHFSDYGYYADFRALRAADEQGKWEKEAKAFRSGVDNRKVKRLAKLKAQFNELEAELAEAGLDLDEIDIDSLI